MTIKIFKKLNVNKSVNTLTKFNAKNYLLFPKIFSLGKFEYII